MNKIHQLEIRKLLKELDYVKSEYEYKNEIVFEADNSFMRSLNDFLEKNFVLKEMFDEKVNGKIDSFVKSLPKDIKEEVAEISLIDKVVDKVVDKNIKKIYRNIVKKTHPDKISDIRLNDLYIAASDMYDSNDIIGIYSICDQLGIPYELSEEELGVLKSQISIIKERVSFMEKTFTWKWYNAEGENEKSQILFEYIKSKII
jgi:hypothetical protein